MRSKISCVVVGLSFVIAATPANADMAVGVLTFDDLPALSEGVGAPIPVGYGGAGVTWTNMNYLNTIGHPTAPNGAASPPYVAYNPDFSPLINPALVLDGPFNFGGAYLTAIWRDGLNIKVEGYLGTNLLYTKTVTVDNTGPTWCAFNYYGIDKLQFSSWGGTGGSTAHFVMDNFTVVPVPGAVLLGILGLGVAGWKLHKYA